MKNISPSVNKMSTKEGEFSIICHDIKVLYTRVIRENERLVFVYKHITADGDKKMLTDQDYTIIEQVYKGRTTIYRAHRVADQQPVILKTLDKEGYDLQTLERFKQEYEFIHSLQLNGVIRAYRLEERDQYWFMELEDIQGISLDKIFVTSKKDLASKVKLMIQLAQTLGVFHAHGMVHHNLTPYHVIWNPINQQMRIISFGAASIDSVEKLYLPAINEMDDSGAYLSPEQTGMMNLPVDYRTDLYSLGTIFYQMMTGEPPFKARDAAEMVHSIMTKIPELPDEARSTLPEDLYNIMVKLMAKNPDERYQNTPSLNHDLQQFIAKGVAVEESRDTMGENKNTSANFRIGEKIYGREAELKVLSDSMERVSCGSAEIITIGGSAGSGKTAIVKEFYKAQSYGSAFLINGKCEQFKHNIPYASLIDAFQGLIRQILTERTERIIIWKDQIMKTLGSSAYLMTGMIPNLDLIIGSQSQPPTQPLTPQEAQSRFFYLFKNFLLIFATAEHPLVIFLDDLQWVDSATLQLAREIATDNDAHYLLIIGAYRTPEVDGSHPLRIVMESLKDTGFIMHHIEIDLLNTLQIADLLTDVLQQDTMVVKALAETCYKKTRGNPFFLKRFLYELYQKHCIEFVYENGDWRWHLETIAETAITENVANLLIHHLGRLSEKVQYLLKLAACIGNRFELRLLAALSQNSVAETFQQLEEAIRAELIMSINLDATDEPGERVYRFCHDRVQQTVNWLIPTSQRRMIHRKIGRLLWEQVSENEQVDRIFDIVNHWNYAIEDVNDSAERELLILINLRAGCKAKDSIAYELALHYLTVATDLLGSDGWNVNYDLTYRVLKERVEIEFLNGRFDTSRYWAGQVLSNTKSNLEKVDIFIILILQFTMNNQLSQAVETGREALQLLGEELPGQGVELSVDDQVTKLREMLKNCNMLDWINLPLSDDVSKKAVIKIMSALISPLMFVDKELQIFIQIKIVREALQGNYFLESPIYFAGLGVILGTVYGEYQLGYQLNCCALQMAERTNNLDAKCLIDSSLANYCGAWVKPLHELEEVNTNGYLVSLEAGKIDYAGFILGHKVTNQFYRGTPLNEVSKNIAEYLPFVQKTHNTLATEVLLGFKRRLANLMETDATRNVVKGDSPEQAGNLEDYRTNYGLAYHYLFQSQIFYIFGQADAAYSYIRKAMETAFFLIALFAHGELVFYESLIITELCQKDETKKQQHRDSLAANLKKMKQWADNCPANFFHKYALMAAEQARLDGEFVTAINLYDQAIREAHHEHFIQDEAIANERAAKFWEMLGKDNFVRLYIKQAYDAYRQWGASRKAAQLVEKYPDLFERVDAIGNPAMPEDLNTPARSVALLNLIKSSQVIAEETVFERMLEKMITMIMENVGSQKCFIIVEDGDKLVARAVGKVDEVPKIQLIQPAVDIEESAGIPRSVVRYVARTKEAVILHNAAGKGLFIKDPYIMEYQPKSIICTPILYQGVLTGVVYMENNLSTHAFTTDCIDLLRVFAAQIAIQLNNEQLHEKQGKLSEIKPAVAAVSLDLSRLIPRDNKADYHTEAGIQTAFERFELLFYNSDLKQKQELYALAGSQGNLPRMLVECFGGFEVFVTGKDIVKIKWRTLKAKELFAYLVYQEGSEVPKDTLICHLWPDMELKKANALFRTTLYYLRKVFNDNDFKDVITYDQAGYGLSPDCFSCDARLFIRELEGKEAISTPAEAARIEEAIALYHGGYLDEAGWEWAEKRRLYYQKIAISTMYRLTEYFEKVKEPEKLTQYLEILWDQDPYSTRINELLIRTYIGIGMIKEAKKQYEAYCRVLKKDLGIAPDKSIQELALNYLKRSK